MPRSARVTLAQKNALMQLVAECRDLGDDSQLWRRHIFAGLSRLTGADLAFGGEKTLHLTSPDLPHQHIGDSSWGWENGFNLRGWLDAIQHFEHDPNYSRTEMRYLRRLLGEDGLALTRCDLTRDREWYTTSSVEFIHQHTMGIDHTLWCYRILPGTRGSDINGIILTRAIGRPNFTARDQAVVQMGHALIAGCIGSELARYHEPSPLALPHRVRQVLLCILQGDSDKQIHLRLGISVHTVREYTQRIFRHFRVRGRGELQSRWVRRRWKDAVFDGDASALSNRARQVLRCFLEGDGDRDVGLRLGLTRHTVNQYAKQIYEHFGVTSRAELLGRWITRDWRHFAWNEPT